jgi:hypothetical protein
LPWSQRFHVETQAEVRVHADDDEEIAYSPNPKNADQVGVTDVLHELQCPCLDSRGFLIATATIQFHPPAARGRRVCWPPPSMAAALLAPSSGSSLVNGLLRRVVPLLVVVAVPEIGSQDRTDHERPGNHTDPEEHTGIMYTYVGTSTTPKSHVAMDRTPSRIALMTPGLAVLLFVLRVPRTQSLIA